jgi:hypothetical protein
MRCKRTDSESDGKQRSLSVGVNALLSQASDVWTFVQSMCVVDMEHPSQCLQRQHYGNLLDINNEFIPTHLKSVAFVGFASNILLFRSTIVSRSAMSRCNSAHRFFIEMNYT